MSLLSFFFKKTQRKDLFDSIAKQDFFLEEVWYERENAIYCSLFKKIPEQIYVPVKAKKFTNRRHEGISSRAGVLEIPPSEQKNYWT